MKTFLALFMGSDTPTASPADMDAATRDAGMAAWGAWMQTHGPSIVDSGGPLGVTKSASRAGIADIRNHVGGYVIVTAPSHAHAAAMFENHPHFAIFPGDRVEVMERLPIPGA